MLLDGYLKIYRLENTAEKGLMPEEKLVKKLEAYYGERTVGFSRQYAAMGVNQQVDLLVRIWRADVSIHDYAVLEDGRQYRIDNVQHLLDEDGLKVTDLTLFRLEGNYDIAE